MLSLRHLGLMEVDMRVRRRKEQDRWRGRRTPLYIPGVKWSGRSPGNR